MTDKQFDELSDRCSKTVDRNMDDLSGQGDRAKCIAIFLGMKLIAYAIFAVAKAISNANFSGRSYGTGPG